MTSRFTRGLAGTLCIAPDYIGANPKKSARRS